MDDYYKLLGVSPTATTAEIKRAYRKLANELHPDRLEAERATIGDDPALLVDLEQRIQAATERMQQINAAYDVLKDPSRRRIYDFMWNRTSIPRRPPPRRRTDHASRRPPPRHQRRTSRQPPPPRQAQQPQPQSRSSSFESIFEWNGIWLVFGFLAIALYMSTIIPKDIQLTDPYEYLIGEAIPTTYPPFGTSIQSILDPTLTPAQERYNQGMQALRDLVDGGTLQVEGQQAVQHFRRATQLDPTMAEAYRNYGLLMFEFWKLSPYDSTWQKANDALLKFRDLTGQPDPDVDAALEQLANPRGT